jgi:hypothetical protein
LPKEKLEETLIKTSGRWDRGWNRASEAEFTVRLFTVALYISLLDNKNKLMDEK